ncbi:MAG: hypothetical protein LC808_09445, partial [Actinobacteria bacterium]|nr:hypothetical protein [Actinomycetota bacterium]
MIAVPVNPTIVDGDRTFPGHPRCPPAPCRAESVLCSEFRVQVDSKGVMRMADSGFLPRTRLEQLVGQLRRTRDEFGKDFARTAAQLNETITVSTRQVGRWMAGNVDGVPRPAACRVLEQMFGESAERLFGPPDPAPRVEITKV